MLYIVWCLAAADADIEAMLLTDSDLFLAKEYTMSGS